MANGRISFRELGNTLEWSASDGGKNFTVTFDATKPSAEIGEIAKLHGFKQKIGDAAAMSRNPVTGKPATMADKFAAMTLVRDNLYRNIWNARRENVNLAVFVAAVAEVRNVSEAAVMKRLETWTPAEIRNIMRRTDVAEAMLKIRRERYPDETTDSDDELFAGLVDESETEPEPAAEPAPEPTPEPTPDYSKLSREPAAARKGRHAS